jgi:hypothetical protein
LAPALSLLVLLTAMAVQVVWKNLFLIRSNTLIETTDFDERSRLAAVLAFEKLSARQPKPNRIIDD